MNERQHTEKLVREILPRHLQDTFWGRRIIKSAKHSGFRSFDKHGASYWPTCACGEMYARKTFERAKITGEPVDNMLFILGQKFEKAVKDDLVIKSAMLLVEIENRGAELQGETE